MTTPHCSVPWIETDFYKWAGNGSVDYFLDGVLETAGVHDETKKMNINLGKSCLQFSFVSSLHHIP